MDNVQDYYSYFRVWVTGATDYGNWNLTCSGMEIYGDWCELEEVKEEEDPEILAQNHLIERSGFTNTSRITFSIKRRVIRNKHKNANPSNSSHHSKSSKSKKFGSPRNLGVDINFSQSNESESDYDKDHPASLVQARSLDEAEMEQDQEAVIFESPLSTQLDIKELTQRLKQMLLDQEYPIQYGKRFKIRSPNADNEVVVVTILMMEDAKDNPMGIGWVSEDTQFCYDETRNGISCDYLYDAVPALSVDGVQQNSSKPANGVSGKTTISEQELLKDFIPKTSFSIGPIMALDPDVVQQYKNRDKRKQDAIDKYHELKQLKLKMELKATEEELKKEAAKKKAEEEKQKEYDDKVLETKQKHVFPEWFEALREYMPGKPLQLYAVAWKLNNQEADAQQSVHKAMNWILDEGPKFMEKRPKEFNVLLALDLPKKVEELAPEQVMCLCFVEWKCSEIF